MLFFVGTKAHERARSGHQPEEHTRTASRVGPSERILRLRTHPLWKVKTTPCTPLSNGARDTHRYDHERHNKVRCACLVWFSLRRPLVHVELLVGPALFGGLPDWESVKSLVVAGVPGLTLCTSAYLHVVQHIVQRRCTFHPGRCHHITRRQRTRARTGGRRSLSKHAGTRGATKTGFTSDAALLSPCGRLQSPCNWKKATVMSKKA